MDKITRGTNPFIGTFRAMNKINKNEVKHSSSGGEKSEKTNSELKRMGESLRGWRLALSSALDKAG